MTTPALHRGFIFDVDATLVDTISIINEIWKTWAEIKNLNFSDVYPHVHGRKINETLVAVDPKFNNDDDIAEVKSIAFEKMKSATAIEGAIEFVEQIPPNMWSIATSGPYNIAKTSLTASGFTLPKVMICGEDVTQGKPHPEPFLAAAKALGIPPEQCIAFEDSPVGIQSAKAAGCYTIALRTSHLDHELLAADTIIDNFNDISFKIENDNIHIILL
ncbi:HAD-IA family hydrolase [Photobacterium toruni]|uniref:HAD-IA family hydrolase n=1 Tax=Photobacterium toruni TaxID=1935446 RepID=UPI002110D208|nr:HAD-IA family hydrolase [Photobacterium toruni]